jgi:hypothetical protein
VLLKPKSQTITKEESRAGSMVPWKISYTPKMPRVTMRQSPAPHSPHPTIEKTEKKEKATQ